MTTTFENLNTKLIVFLVVVNKNYRIENTSTFEIKTEKNLSSSLLLLLYII
jgi:hypothetical protein